MVLGDVDSYVQKNETQSPTYTIHKNKLSCIKDLCRSCDKVKFLEENIGRKISDIPHSNIFIPRARDIKDRIKKWEYIK